MIQELKIKNFLSFKEEMTLSFEAAKDSMFEGSQVVEVAQGVRLLRFIMVLGPNASGKSNLLESLQFLRTFWFSKITEQDQSTGAIPFMLSHTTKEQPSQFELKFYINGTKYWYQLSLDKDKIHYEKLFYYKSNQPSLLFDRKLEDGHTVITFNSNLKLSNVLIEEFNIKCLNNKSFFAARNQINCSIPLIDEVSEWLKNSFLPIIKPRAQMMEYAGGRMMDDSELRQYILQFIHEADFNITDVKSHREDIAIPQDVQEALLKDDHVSERAKEKLRKSPVVSHMETEFEHTVHTLNGDEKFILPADLQSEGTQRIFGIEAALYECLHQNKILLIDEMESSLHPDLLKMVIERYLQEQKNSQLLITTHYDLLLNEANDTIRKDSVWFTSKEEDGSTRLYPLLKFPGLNKLSSIQRSYRHGKFGAVPSLKMTGESEEGE